jgi:DNA-binding transcriptional ArsR family regulator
MAFFIFNYYRNIAILKYVMGLTKTQIFTERQNKMAIIFKVLAHPARIAILEFISRQDACICNDIVDEIGLAQPTISQHLKELKSIDLIQGEIEGKKVCYCINMNQWTSVQEQLNTFFNTTKNNCC